MKRRLVSTIWARQANTAWMLRPYTLLQKKGCSQGRNFITAHQQQRTSAQTATAPAPSYLPDFTWQSDTNTSDLYQVMTHGIFPDQIPTNMKAKTPNIRLPRVMRSKKQEVKLAAPKKQDSWKKLRYETRTAQLLNNIRERMKQKLANVDLPSEPVSDSSTSTMKSKAERKPTVAQKAFDVLEQASDVLGKATSAEFQQRVVDALFTQIHTHYAAQPALFARLIHRLMDICDYHDRTDLAEMVFAQAHKHMGTKLLNAGAISPYSALVVMLCRRGRLEKIDSVFHAVESHGLRLNAKAFNAAIIANAAAKRQAAAFNYLGRMVTAGWQPRPAPINALIAMQNPNEEGYFKRVEWLLAMLDQLPHGKRPSSANASTFTPLLAQVTTHSQLEFLWSHIVSRGLHRNPTIQRHLLYACLRLPVNVTSLIDFNIQTPDITQDIPITIQHIMASWQTMLGRFQLHQAATADAYRVMLKAYAQKNNFIGAYIMAGRLAAGGHHWYTRDMQRLLCASGRFPAGWKIDGQIARATDLISMLHCHRHWLWRIANRWVAQRYWSASPQVDLAPQPGVMIMSRQIYQRLLAALGRVKDINGLWQIWHANTSLVRSKPMLQKSSRPSTSLVTVPANEQLLMHLRDRHTYQLRHDPVNTVLTFLRAMHGFPQDALDLWYDAPAEAQTDPMTAEALLNTLTQPDHTSMLLPILLALIQHKNRLWQDESRAALAIFCALQRLTGSSHVGQPLDIFDMSFKPTKSSRSTASPTDRSIFVITKELASLATLIRNDNDIQSAVQSIQQTIPTPTPQS